MMVDEPKKDGSKPWLGYVMKAAGLLVVSSVGFVASLIWKEYEKIGASQTAIERRLGLLEEDKAKWATLAAMEQKLVDLRIRMEVMRQVWSYEYGREIPTGFPKRSGEPRLVPPEELFRDIENYRNMMQQKIPPEYMEKKK